jgi:hypothetical protein
MRTAPVSPDYCRFYFILGEYRIKSDYIVISIIANFCLEVNAFLYLFKPRNTLGDSIRLFIERFVR